jgi:hypothetical protein
MEIPPTRLLGWRRDSSLLPSVACRNDKLVGELHAALEAAAPPKSTAHDAHFVSVMLSLRMTEIARLHSRGASLSGLPGNRVYEGALLSSIKAALSGMG